MYFFQCKSQSIYSSWSAPQLFVGHTACCRYASDVNQTWKASLLQLTPMTAGAKEQRSQSCAVWRENGPVGFEGLGCPKLDETMMNLHSTLIMNSW